MSNQASLEAIRQDKKEAILAAYVETRNLLEACKQLSIGYSTVWYWINQDADFKREYEAANRAIGDQYLDQARAIASDIKHKDCAITNMFMIKRYHPEFRDQTQVTINNVHLEAAQKFNQYLELGQQQPALDQPVIKEIESASGDE